MAVSIGIRDQSEIINYYKKFPTIQESTYLSVEMKKWKKNYENIPFEERPATAGNSAFSIQTSSSHSHDRFYSSYWTRGKCSCERPFPA